MELKMPGNAQKNSGSARSNVSIMKDGSLLVDEICKITPKSRLYDRLGTWEHLNPRMLAGIEFLSAHFPGSDSAPSAYERAVLGIYASLFETLAGRNGNREALEKIQKSVNSFFGKSDELLQILKARNMELLAMHDVAKLLGMDAGLAMGNHCDLRLRGDNIDFFYPDENASYSGEGKQDIISAKTPAEACSLVHTILGEKSEGLAENYRKRMDHEAAKKEIAISVRHYEEAVGFDDGNDVAILDLAGYYNEAGKYAKAAKYYMRLVELAEDPEEKVKYLAYVAETIAKTGDVDGMIRALRLFEALQSQIPENDQLKKVAEALRIGIARALET